MRPTNLKSAYAFAQSDQSLRFPYEDTLHPLLSKMRPVKILIRLRESDLNLCWAHMSDGTITYVAAHFTIYSPFCILDMLHRGSRDDRGTHTVQHWLRYHTGICLIHNIFSHVGYRLPLIFLIYFIHFCKYSIIHNIFVLTNWLILGTHLPDSSSSNKTK